MEVFNGAKFLESKGCKFELTNGKAFEVREVRPEQLDKIMKMPDEPDANSMKVAVAGVLDCEVSELDEIGIVELKGVMDFLSENLLS